MTRETFFTADTHFGHAGLINHGYRPKFSSVEEMDENLVQRWNAVVRPCDSVWHLGDFTLANADAAQRYRARLNGEIHLVWGNHDRTAVRNLPIWASSQYAADIRLDGTRITLCHYAMRVWDRCQHGALMLHGHSHGNMPGTRQSLDVGVDAWEFAPVNLDTIRARMATLPTFDAGDHHATPRRPESAGLPAEMTPAIAEVLGRPNFMCGAIAEAYRHAGHEIPRKAEAEQAFVLFRFLPFAIVHGEGWTDAARADWEAARRAAEESGHG